MLICLPETEHSKQAINKILLIANRLLDKESAALAAGCSDGAVLMWNLQKRKAYARWRATARNSSVCTMTITSDGAELYVGDHLGEQKTGDDSRIANKSRASLKTVHSANVPFSSLWNNPLSFVSCS